MDRIKALFARLTQPSSMAGLSALAMLAGVPPNTVSLAAQVVVGLAGTVAIVRDDGSGK